MKLTTEEQKTIKAYDDNAKAWVKSRNVQGEWEEEKKKFKKYLPSRKILEIGSGGGRDAKELIDTGYEYIGIDISKGLLEEAKKNTPEATFLLQSVYDLDFPQETFDGFWACAVLLHMPKDRMSEALKSIHKVMKKGAIGFISLKKGEGEKFVEGDHLGQIKYSRFFSFWETDEFAQVLKQTDFQILESYTSQFSDKPWLVFFVKVV